MSLIKAWLSCLHGFSDDQIRGFMIYARSTDALPQDEPGIQADSDTLSSEQLLAIKYLKDFPLHLIESWRSSVPSTCKQPFTIHLSLGLIDIMQIQTTPPIQVPIPPRRFNGRHRLMRTPPQRWGTPQEPIQQRVLPVKLSPSPTSSQVMSRRMKMSHIHLWPTK